MRLNVLAYNFRTHDGYGRYCAYLIRALRRAGVAVTPHFIGAADAPAWLASEWGIDWGVPTLSCLPPYFLRKLPDGSAPHWLLTMTEGSECPNGWAETINAAGISRVIVPCQHNADAFQRGGVDAPIHVVHGGTDPDEFPIRVRVKQPGEPYTFLTLADRGSRKGWTEVYAAFYQAFGGKTTGDMDVRLVIKCRPKGNALIDLIRTGVDLDPRIVYAVEDAPSLADVYAGADCFVIPSRSEGWGMPHREAACMGVPVITQAYSGMDDGHTHEWAVVIEGGQLQPVEAPKDGHIKGVWRVADVTELAEEMRDAYVDREWFAEKGKRAAHWIRSHQTWQHTAAGLIALMREHGFVGEEERVYA